MSTNTSHGTATDFDEATLDGLLEAFRRSGFLESASYAARQAARPFLFAALKHACGKAEIAEVGQHEQEARRVLEGHTPRPGATLRPFQPVADWRERLRGGARPLLEALDRPEPVSASSRDEASDRTSADATQSDATISSRREPEPTVAEDAPIPGGSTPPVVVGAENAHCQLRAEHPGEDAPLVSRAELPTGGDVAEAAWPKPVELVEVFGPAFPIDALARWHRKYVEELAEQVQIAADAAAVASLTAFGGAAANTATVGLQRGDYHPLNMWSQIVCPPGDGKTPLLDEIRKPFDKFQEELRDAARQGRAELTSERRVLQIEVGRLEVDAAGSTDAEERKELIVQAGALRQKLEAIATSLPTLTTGDCTQAGARALMAENHGRVMLLSDEGEQLFSRIQQGSTRTTNDIELMLQAYSGVRIDRRLHRAEARVANAALTLLLLIQPGPFGRVMNVSSYHDKGLMSRFMLAVPRSLKGTRKQRRAGLSDEAAENYSMTVRALLARPIKPESVLSFSPGGFEAFAAWAAAIDLELSAARQTPFLAWLGKLRGHTVRLAGILHLTNEPQRVATESTISQATVERAIEIARYFRDHALLAYEQSTNASLDEDPRRVLRWLRDGRKQTFSVAEAVTAFSNRLASADITRCVERLVDTGYLRERPGGRSGRGRPRKPTYAVNPWLFLAEREN